MLRDSTVVAIVMRTRSRAIPLAMITMRKSTHGFPFLSYTSMGLCLAALQADRVLPLPNNLTLLKVGYDKTTALYYEWPH